jgi:hypothetical protein
VLALAAALAQLGVEAVDGGGVDPVERETAEAGSSFWSAQRR